MLAAHDRRYEFLSQQLSALEGEIAQRMEPHAGLVAALATIPGVDRVVAWHLIAELGTDMAVFPDADHWPPQERQQGSAADSDAGGLGCFAR